MGNSESSSEDLQRELLLQFDKVERERSILEYRIGDNVFDSEIFVVRFDEVVVFLDMRDLLTRRARFREVEPGSLVDEGVQVSEVLVEVNEVSCLVDAIELVEETWSFSHTR